MTPQTNEVVAKAIKDAETKYPCEHIGQNVLAECVSCELATAWGTIAAKDTRIHSLEAEVEELKKQILDMKLLPNQGHACDGFCLGTCLHGTRLAANLKIAVEALETVRGQSPCDYIAWEGRQGCKVHENSHQCLAHDTLSRLKSGGGGS